MIPYALNKIPETLLKQGILFKHKEIKQMIPQALNKIPET